MSEGSGSEGLGVLYSGQEVKIRFSKVYRKFEICLFG